MTSTEELLKNAKALCEATKNSVDGPGHYFDRNVILRLISALEVAIEAMKTAEVRISHTSLTMMPINVREPDGAISSHRPKSNEGHAYEALKNALAQIDQILRGEADENK